MVAPFPRSEPKKLKDLLAALDRGAAAMIPDLSRPPPAGEFGHAFYEIAARMAAEVTTRLEGVPRRDAVAFFDALDIPPMAPQAATAPVVFTLTDKADVSVAAPKRTQVTADAKDGEVVFETIEELAISPARLERLVAVDVDTDRIEEGPTGVLLAEPRPESSPNYKVATFASEGTATVQIAPVLGLQEGDILRIGAAPDAPVYRIEKVERDLFTLKPPLEAAAGADAPVTKVTRFEAFQLRNAQTHQVYIGHKELLNLKQKARITLTVEPLPVRRVLAAMTLRLDLWSIKPPAEDPAWNPLELESAGANGLVFLKDWVGEVAEEKIFEEKSRWLRLVLVDPLPNQGPTDTRIETIELKVESAGEDEPASANGSAAPKPTVEKAFHNATPLSVSTQFQPFGAEPQRFDTFSLSAPEAFSKRGAKVTLTIGLVDATPVTLAMASVETGLPRAYGISRNGQLQAFALDGSTVQWQSIAPPTTAQLPTGAPAAGGDRTLTLDPGRTLQSVQATSQPTDLVLVQDTDGRLWSQSIEKPGSNAFVAGVWTPLQPIDATDQTVTKQAVILMDAAGLFILALHKDGARMLRIATRGVASGAWTPLDAALTPKVNLGGEFAVARVEGSAWPSLPQSSDVVLVDGDGGLFRGVINASAAPPTITWTKLAASALFTAKIKPAASETTPGKVTLAAADSDKRIFRLTGDTGWSSLVGNQGTIVRPTLVEGTSIQCLPPDIGSDRAVISAVAEGSGAGQTQVVLWTHDDRIVPAQMSADAPAKPSAAWLPPSFASTPADVEVLPSLLAGGAGESVVSAPMERERQSGRITMHDIARLARAVGDQPLAPAFIEIGSDDHASASVERKPVDAIDHGLTQYFPLPTGSLAPGQQYTFLEIKQGASEDKPGKRNAPKELKLAASDPADLQSLLVIRPELTSNDREVYQILALDNTSHVATLDRDFPTGPSQKVLYTTCVKVPNGVQTATRADLATLGDFGAPVGRVHSIEVSAGSPARQRVALTEGDWLIVSNPNAGASAWTQVPPASTPATLHQEQTIAGFNTTQYARNYQNPELSWEYFDGRGWQVLPDLDDRTGHLAQSDVIKFTVPVDLEQTDVAGQTDYWIRARLIGGDYGRAKYIVKTTPNPPPPAIATSTTQSITIDTSELHPPEIQSIKASFVLEEPVSPELVLVQNNGTTLNQTQASAQDNATFELFEGPRALDRPGEPERPIAGRMLFLGFSREFKVDVLTLYVNAEDEPGKGTLQAEILTERGWKAIASRDETNGFRRRGIVRLFVDSNPVRVPLFNGEHCWLRFGVRDIDGAAVADWAPKIAGLYVNAVMAEQAETIEQELIGSSLGEPNAKFTLSRPPVLLNGVEIRVSERLSDEEEKALLAEPQDPKRVVSDPDLEGKWVLWERTDSFIGKDADQRVYRLDAEKGELQFGGDGEGKALPAGRDVVRAFSYKNGGGERGNVEAFEIKNLKTALDLVDTVVNPVEAAGGIDQPDVKALIATAPARIRHAGHALSPADFEALAVASSPDVVRARHVMPADAASPMQLAVAIRTGERCPKPSSARREGLAKTILADAAGFLDRDSLVVVLPDYVRVTVAVKVHTVSAEGSGEVGRRVRDALVELMHPIDGGPEKAGWPFGRPIWESDIYRVIGGLPGVDRISSVEIATRDGHALDGLGATAVIWSDEDDIRVTVEPGDVA